MASCKCPTSEITATDWQKRFDAAKCKCRHNGRLHAEENNRKIEICGTGYKDVDKIKVDGGLIPKSISECCDYFFGHQQNGSPIYSNNVFVELKGCAVEKAVDQIICTIGDFKVNGKLPFNSLINGVIVSSSVPKAVGSTRTSKFKRIAGKDGKLHIKNHKLIYDIVNNIIVN